jgi:AraC-like DNA-binding protein
MHPNMRFFLTTSLLIAFMMSSTMYAHSSQRLRAFFQTYDYHGALNLLSDQLSKGASSSDSQRAEWMMERARLFLRFGDLTNAHLDASNAFHLADSIHVDSTAGRAAQVLVEINEITGDFKSARKYVNICFSRFMASGLTLLEAEAHQVKGSFLRSINQLDSAERFLNHCITLATSAEAHPVLAKAHNNLGIIQAMRNDLSSAYIHFKTCYNLLLHKHLHDETICESLTNLAYYHLFLKQTDSAQYYAIEQLKWSRKLAYPITEQQAYWILSKVHTNTGAYDSALHYLEKHHALKDSLFNSEVAQRVRLSEYISQIEVIQLENDLMTSELQVASFRNLLWIGFSVFLVAISTALVALYIRRTRENKILFNRVQDLLETRKQNVFIGEKESLRLDPKVENEIHERLRLWEIDRGFLVKDCTLEYVAKQCDTNSKYLSLTITQHKNMRFPEYINHLRIQYILDQLQSDKRIRNYTVEALADLIGYRSTTSFTSAFKSITLLTPSSYIRELKRTAD